MVTKKIVSSRFKYDSKSVIELSDIQVNEKIRFEELLKNNASSLEMINCPICGSNKSVIISEKDRYGFNHIVNLCLQCSLIYVSPRYNNKTLIYFYENVYRSLYGQEKPKDLFDAQIKRGNTIFKFINKKTNLLLRDKLNVLEIGCGAGGILYPFMKKGHNVVGTDFNIDFLNYGKSKGLSLFYYDKKQIEKLLPQMDLIILSHVAEHMRDAIEELKSISERMNSNCLIYIEVPGVFNNKYGFVDFLKQLQNAHLFYFTKQSFINILSKAELNILYADRYIRVIARKNKSNIVSSNIFVANPYKIIMLLKLREYFLRHLIKIFYYLLESIKMFIKLFIIQK